MNANQVRIEGFIYAQFLGRKPHYLFSTGNYMAEHGYTLIGPHVLEYEIPADFNPVAAQVTSLEEKKQILTKDFQAAVARINDEISKLQCLEFEPSGRSDDA